LFDSGHNPFKPDPSLKGKMIAKAEYLLANEARFGLLEMVFGQN
jgi:hypothetical protein